VGFELGKLTGSPLMSVRRLSLLFSPTINAKSGWGCTGMAINANKEGNCAKVLPHQCKPSAIALRRREHMVRKNKRLPGSLNWMTSPASGEPVGCLST
jgi:hypothetical protein